MYDSAALPSTKRLTAPEPFELWRVDLGVAPHLTEQGILSAAERERAARFVFVRDRDRYLAAHAALRRLLADRTGTSPAALRLATGAHGKPFLEAPAHCSFNLSHSGDLALVALAPDGEIGVDVELLRPVPDATALAERHYTPAEREALAGTATAGRDLAFLIGWTRKEACLKAIGSGLSIEAAAVDAGLQPERRIVRITTAAGLAAVEVVSLQGHGWVGALARTVGS